MSSYEVLPSAVDRKTLLQCEFSKQRPTGGGGKKDFPASPPSTALSFLFPDLSLNTGDLREA